MQYSATLESDAVVEAESNALPESVIQAGSRPYLDSFDSAHEFSFEHLMEVYRLVELADYELDRYVFDDACLRVV